MTPRQIRFMHEAILTRNFVTAAHNLNTTPEALREQIAHLETQLGVRLFVGCQPTREARKLLACTESLVRAGSGM